MSNPNATMNTTMISVETVVPEVVAVVRADEAVVPVAPVVVVAALGDHRYNESCVQTNFNS